MGQVPTGDYFRGHGLQSPADDALTRINACLKLRAHWGATHDLVGPQAARDPWQVDVLDGIAVNQILADKLQLVDVGAGAGVPGLIVACLDPLRPVVLIEPRVKRAAFLRSAKHALNLPNVRVVRGRWPAAVQLTQPSQVVSRAVVPPDDWPSLAAAGGALVHEIIRMLGRKRPPVELPSFRLATGFEYREGTERRVERWSRVVLPSA